MNRKRINGGWHIKATPQEAKEALRKHIETANPGLVVEPLAHPPSHMLRVPKLWAARPK